MNHYRRGLTLRFILATLGFVLAWQNYSIMTGTKLKISTLFTANSSNDSGSWFNSYDNNSNSGWEWDSSDNSQDSAGRWDSSDNSWDSAGGWDSSDNSWDSGGDSGSWGGDGGDSGSW